MASFYRKGWRQGSLLSASLSCNVLDQSDALVEHSFNEWVVVTQECDLDGAEEDATEPLIELRPVYKNEGDVQVGIRSEVFVVDHERWLHAQSPRLMVTPRRLAELSTNEPPRISVRRSELLKTWLGLRYDRPAVPDAFVQLAKAVARAVKGKKGEVADQVLDVLMRFEAGDPPGVGLYAVTEDDTHRDSVEIWLQKVAEAVPQQVGVVRETRSATVHQISLWTIQNTYSADVSQLSITDADRREV